MGFWPPCTMPRRTVPETEPVEDVVTAGMLEQPERRRAKEEKAIARNARTAGTPFVGLA